MINYRRTRTACFFSFVTGSCGFCLSPILFVTFREMYGISYTLLGTLVLINFCTQLATDLVFSFCSKRMDIGRAVQAMPLISALGLLVFSVVPNLLPSSAYLGLALGTVLFSVAAGMGEVLLSPLFAALPSESPDRDMSLLHSLYAWGVVGVVVISTLYLRVFGETNWLWLAVFFAALQMVSFVLFYLSPMPHMAESTKASSKKRNTCAMALCFICIFLGGATENTMTNWISGYMETALSLPKVAGDILGMASFAFLLGIGRTWYAKCGKNITRIMTLCMAASAVCYITAGVCLNIWVSLGACALTGLAASMLWPGTLILMEENFPSSSVAAYALMAAGGDLGSSVAPQMLGIVVDKVSATALAVRLGERFGITSEQVGMKAGMLAAAIFPVLGLVLIIYIGKYFKKLKTKE